MMAASLQHPGFKYIADIVTGVFTTTQMLDTTKVLLGALSNNQMRSFEKNSFADTST